MKFFRLAEVFNQIESLSSRLEMTKILSDLLADVSAEEASTISYLVLGQLNPEYIGTQFNLAEKSIFKVIAQLLNKTTTEVVAEYDTLGDLGSLLINYQWSTKQSLTVLEVYQKLKQIEKISGSGSQEGKQELLHSLLIELDPLSAKFVVRIILGTLRLGFSDMTVIDALSWMLVGSKQARVQIEHAYNLAADLGQIAYVAKRLGLVGLTEIVVRPGIPIRPAAAERAVNATEVFEKIGPCLAQPKLDGFRLQVHLYQEDGANKIKFFSRNLLDMSHMFPDLVAAFEKLNLQSNSLICEGEAIAYDEESETFAPFQETVKRRRKHGVAEFAESLPLKLVLFDILYLNGAELLSKTMEERYQSLSQLFGSDPTQQIFVVSEVKITNAQQLEDYFMQEVALGLEGIIAKKMHANYQPGKRNFNWIKLKRKAANELNDSLDCVILGYYLGRGKRTHFGIGAFLIGVYNPHKACFQTVAKVGTGLSDQEWIELKSSCDRIAISAKPNNVECAKELVPDIWVMPKIVCTIEADEITRSPLHTANRTEEHPGLALRFPRMVDSQRIDKDLGTATTVDELKKLYNMQFKSQD